MRRTGWCRKPCTQTRRLGAFTLIELLVVVAIIGLLVSILVPSLTGARQEAVGMKCLSNLRVLGQGLNVYVNEHADIMPPSRLPKLSSESCDPWAMIYGRKKYRPTFVATLSSAVGVPPFDDPQECKTSIDMHGEDGDRQNYSYPAYVCPSVPDWTDERNGAYGYNYQFLGNSRLADDADLRSWKNWPVQITWVRYPGRTVMAGDCSGTAAWWPEEQRWPYDDDSRDAQRYGNEGFNLDPPWVDTINGEMANFDKSPQSRTAAHGRHRGKASIVFVDGHGDRLTPEQLGYERDPTTGGWGYDGDNSMWSLDGRDVPWTTDYRPR